MKNNKENLHVNSNVLNAISDITLSLSNYEKSRLCAFTADAIVEANRLLTYAMQQRSVTSPLEFIVTCAEKYHKSIELLPNHELAARLMKHYRPPTQEKEDMYSHDDDNTKPLQYRKYHSTIQPATAKDWTNQEQLADHIGSSKSMKRLAACGIDPTGYMVACASRANETE